MPDPFVTIEPDQLFRDGSTVAGAVSARTLDGIPFATVEGQTLDLAAAGWPDWQEDPSSYYAAYDRVPVEPDPRRTFLRIPAADYECAWLLARADLNPATGQTVTLRIGRFAGEQRTAIRDFAVTVPRLGAADPPVLVRVPIGVAMAQDFAGEETFDVEVTKELRLAIRRPDPCRFQYRPLGPASGVRLHAITFVRSPVTMTVRPLQTGGVFEEPEVPAFEVALTGTGGACRIEAAATGWGGETVTAEATGMPGGPPVRLELAVPRRGWYRLTVRLRRGEQTYLSRETHFASLAPDSRRYRDRAPWGVWDFGGRHFTPDRAEEVGPLYRRAGLRYGMFHFADRDRYGVLKGNDPTVKNAQMARDLARQYRDDGLPPPPRVMIFHEDAISGPHLNRLPAAFSGRPPYRFDDQEAARFETLWNGALEAAREVRRLFPDAEIYFGNGNPHLLEEFLLRGFPRELFDTRGNEAGSFQRLPESQPPDFVANNASLWMDRQLLDHYGYPEKPVRQCYEICYPSTNPGNLALRTQAAYLVRHILHSMVWEIPVIRFGSITDMANSYYYSNWGSSGLCFAKPEVSPKPSYAAVAVLTRVLDGARFRRVVPVTAPTVYAVEFARPGGGCVTCLWTVRGERRVTVTTGPGAIVVDPMGNERPLSAAGDLELTPAPLYLLTGAPVSGLTAGSPAPAPRPPGRAHILSPLDSMGEWQVETERSPELENYEFVCPRRQGRFQFRERAEFEGERRVLEVSPDRPEADCGILPRYAVLRHCRGLELPGEPTAIGLMVNGNGGWGRLIFELVDASGQRWISIGCEQRGKPTAWMADWLPPDQFQALTSANLGDWNTSDAWGRAAICFEGWRYLSFPLPGNYPGEGYHWPYSSQWRHSGDGIVHYPLTFRKLIVSLPDKVLRFRDFGPVPRPEIYLKDLTVTHEPPETAFHAE